jgi:DNA (cytosine-5)-methyltransferase 1
VNVLELFAGAGGGILGGLILGHWPVCAVEIEPYCRQILIERQNDGVLPPFPIWDDVCTFDGRPWAGRVDIVSGGFPCQDISPAGGRAGIEGEQSGLWLEFVRVVREVRPRYVFVENSADLAIRGLDAVLGDLAALGFDAEWGVLGSCSNGAWHHRARMWVLAADPAFADAHEGGQHDVTQHAQVAGIRAHADDADETRRFTGGRREAKEVADPERLAWWTDEPELARVAHGMACRVDRVAALGNGQVPATHALAFRVLRARLEGTLT